MIKQNQINSLKEKIHELEEYINSSGCSMCLSMFKTLKEYEDVLKTLEAKSE